jgi:hypothetical protein
VYVDQSAAELRLNVVGGPLDLRPFTLLRAARIRGTALSVGAAILGASHVLAVRRAGLAELCEVFACRDPGPPMEPARRFYSGGPRELSWEVEEGLAYRFHPEQADLASGAARLRALEERALAARRRRGQIGLHYTFPSSPDLPPARTRPKTVVWVEVAADERRLCVETAHCYPNEDTIVFSTTRIGVGP